MNQAYTTELTLEPYELLESLLPPETILYSPYFQTSSKHPILNSQLI